MNKISCEFPLDNVNQEVYLITSHIGMTIYGIFSSKEKADNRVIELEEEHHPHMYGQFFVNKWKLDS